MCLGQPTYPESKDKGDRSMSAKKGTVEVSKTAALRGPHDMAKAKLLEVQSWSGHVRPPRYAG
jgi:hypothetical protein